MCYIIQIICITLDIYESKSTNNNFCLIALNVISNDGTQMPKWQTWYKHLDRLNDHTIRSFAQVSKTGQSLKHLNLVHFVSKSYLDTTRMRENLQISESHLPHQ